MDIGICGNGTVYFTNKPKPSGGNPPDFGEMLAQAVNDRQSDVSGMSLDDYKRYIYNRISLLPMSGTAKLNRVTVSISDKGFLAMQNDPEYEEWVLGVLKNNFAYNDRWAEFCGGRFVIFSFGEDKEHYRSESSYMSESPAEDDEDKEGFWERRAKTAEENLKRGIKRKLEQHRTEMIAIRRQLEQNGKNAAPELSAAQLLLGQDILLNESGM